MLLLPGELVLKGEHFTEGGVYDDTCEIIIDRGKRWKPRTPAALIRAQPDVCV
jgi:hypothetical protein